MRIVFAAAAAFVILLAACGGGSEATPAPTAGRTDVQSLPAPVPDGKIAITDFHIFPTVTSNTLVVTLPVTAAVPSGDKTSWYTYKDGAWVFLANAQILSGNPPNAQKAFAPIPENVIVFAEPQ